MKKTPLSFYLIALSLPFVLLLILEGGLRVVGIGQHQPLFIPVNNHPDYLQPNPDVIQRYFASPKLELNGLACQTFRALKIINRSHQRLTRHHLRDFQKHPSMLARCNISKRACFDARFFAVREH